MQKKLLYVISNEFTKVPKTELDIEPSKILVQRFNSSTGLMEDSTEV